MKTIFEYNQSSGQLTDKNGNIFNIGTMMVGFEPENTISDVTLNLVKQGLTAEEIIKLKNNELL